MNPEVKGRQKGPCMAAGIEICIYPRSKEFSAEKTFLNLAKNLQEKTFVKNTWLGFTIIHKQPTLTNKPTEETKYLTQGCHSHEDRVSQSEYYRNKYELSDSNCLHYRAFTWLDQMKISDETHHPENDLGDLNLDSFDPWHNNGYAFRSEGNAKLYIEPASRYFVCYDKEFHLDPEYEEYNACVELNLEIIREILLCIVDALDPLSIKVFTGTGSYAPFNSHATYFANPEAFIIDLNMIHDYWIGNFSPYYQAELMPLKECDPVKHKFQFNTMRSAEQRKELWEAYNTWLKLREEVTPEVVIYTWDVKQSVEEGGLDIQRTEQGGAFVFGSDHFFNSFVSDAYLHSLNIAYLLKKEKNRRGSGNNRLDY